MAKTATPQRVVIHGGNEDRAVPGRRACRSGFTAARRRATAAHGADHGAAWQAEGGGEEALGFGALQPGGHRVVQGHWRGLAVADGRRFAGVCGWAGWAGFAGWRWAVSRSLAE